MKTITKIATLAVVGLGALISSGCTAPKCYTQRQLTAGDYAAGALLWYPLVTVGNFGVPLVTDPIDEVFRPENPTAWWDCIYREERSSFTRDNMAWDQD
jgi:hypothetical protein|tara:strand:- start:77 stop:373 length:297 start_codon:yes stop_codon:yes gene_type:complete